MMINMLQDQLRVANDTIRSMSASMRSMSSTIDELRKQVANLESMLKERDRGLAEANARMRGLRASFLPKRSERRAVAAPKTEAAKA